MSLPRPGRRTRVLLWRLRIPGAALCCGLAAALVLQTARPAPTPTTTVVVAARTVEAGAVLDAADLRLVELPTALTPAGATGSPSDLTGRSTRIVVTEGLPLVEALTSDGSTVATAPPGTVVVPVRLDPTVVALLTAGDRVDLLGTGSGPPATATTEEGSDEGSNRPDPYLARSAVVLPAPRGPEEGSWGVGDASGVVLVAVSPTEAERLADGEGWEEVLAVLVP